MIDIVKELFKAVSFISAKTWNVVLLILLCLSLYKCAVVRTSGSDSARTVTKRDTVLINSRTVVSSGRVSKIDISSYNVPRYVAIHIRDTVFVPRDTVLLREQKEYMDSSYHAYVSGIDARLDSIRTFARTVETHDTVTCWRDFYIKEAVDKKQKRLRIGLQFGYGMTPKGFQPYIGCGVAYVF